MPTADHESGCHETEGETEDRDNASDMGEEDAKKAFTAWICIQIFEQHPGPVNEAAAEVAEMWKTMQVPLELLPEIGEMIVSNKLNLFDAVFVHLTEQLLGQPPPVEVLDGLKHTFGMA